MTLEFSLRRRATQSRILAILWLSLAIFLLVSTYFTLPAIARGTLSSVSKIENASPEAPGTPRPEENADKSRFRGELYALGVMSLGLIAIAFACFLLGRSAFVEIELAARFNGIADALCVGSETVEDFEKAVNLLVPAARYLSVPEIFSVSNFQSAADLIGKVKGK
jgi:hypothetical protein